MSEKRDKDADITAGQLLYRFRNTDLYSTIMQTQVPEGETSNYKLLQAIFSNNSLLGPIINFVSGGIDKTAALGVFVVHFSSNFERYSEIEQFCGKLFNELARIVRTILKIQDEGNGKVEEVMKAQEAPTTKPTPKPKPKPETLNENTISLAKNKPETIPNAKKLTVTIIRKGNRKNHVLEIVNLNRELVVTCPTSDAPGCKEMRLIVEKGTEYVAGMHNRRMINRFEEKLTKATEKVETAQQTHGKCKIISEVSVETISALEKLNNAKQGVREILTALEHLKSNPLLHWFDPEKSQDISQDHIIIEFDDEGKIIITDEGNECTATLEINT